MSTSLLSLYGLSVDNLQTFGLGGSQLVSYFGENVVEDFVEEVLNEAGAVLPSYSGNVGSFFDTMVDAFEFSEENGLPSSDILGAMVTAWNDAENTLEDNTGLTFDDIDFNVDGGVVTVNVGGNTSTVDLADAIDQAGAQAGVDTSVLDSFI